MGFKSRYQPFYRSNHWRRGAHIHARTIFPIKTDCLLMKNKSEPRKSTVSQSDMIFVQKSTERGWGVNPVFLVHLFLIVLDGSEVMSLRRNPLSRDFSLESQVPNCGTTSYPHCTLSSHHRNWYGKNNLKIKEKICRFFLIVCSGTTKSSNGDEPTLERSSKQDELTYYSIDTDYTIINFWTTDFIDWVLGYEVLKYTKVRDTLTI